MGEKLFKKLGIDKDLDPLETARALPWEKIVETEESLYSELDINTGVHSSYNPN
ncbi:MAG: hypothetical protein P8Y80_08455 [Acidobacteriota bacterium]